MEMESSDKLVVDTAEARNGLEEYVYETRSKLEMAWPEYFVDDVSVEFMKNLSSMEEWLYTDEGKNATKSIYVDKLNGLKKVGEPVALRYRESEMRPSTEKAFRNCANSVLLSVKADDRFEHISKDELDVIIENGLGWLNGVIGKQNEAGKAADVVVTCKEITMKKDGLFGKVIPVLTRVKPEP
jgi:heat shock protein 4